MTKTIMTCHWESSG